MVIVDTSIWVDSLRTGDARLGEWMAADRLLQHPFVTAEIGMGSFQSADARFRVIDLLVSFAQLPIADSQSLQEFVGENALYGTGIGFADAHLLHACISNPTAQLATRDKRLARQAEAMGIVLVD